MIEAGALRAPGDSSDPRRSAQEQVPQRRRRGALYLVIAAILALALGLGAWWFGFARYTSAPGVLSLTAAQAEKKIEGAGLAYAEGDPAYSETVERGMVLSSAPAAGDRVLDGGPRSEARRGGEGGGG